MAVNMTNQAQRMQDMLARSEMLQAPGAPDVLTARLVEHAGFNAIYMTGFGATASTLGVPDIGLMTQTEMLTQARNMVRVTNVPIIADADAELEKKLAPPSAATPTGDESNMPSSSEATG